MQESPIAGAPKFLIFAPDRISAEQAKRVKDAWKSASEKNEPLVLSNEFKVFAMNGDGSISLLNGSAATA